VSAQKWHSGGGRWWEKRIRGFVQAASCCTKYNQHLFTASAIHWVFLLEQRSSPGAEAKGYSGSGLRMELWRSGYLFGKKNREWKMQPNWARIT
jgi:hypothetical protein